MDDLFLTDQNKVSRRFAVLEDDGNCAWLYLTEPDSRRPVADAWVYNRIEAPSTNDIKSYMGRAPPAAVGYVGNLAQCLEPQSHNWTFLWSVNGESVAIAKDGEPMAYILAGEKRGYSRELIKVGPWGSPWSVELFRKTFNTT